MYGTEGNSILQRHVREIRTSNTSLSTQSRPFVGGTEVKPKIRRDQIPREGRSFRIIAGPRVAEKAVVRVRDLDIHVRFPGAFAFVHDSPNLFRADVFIESAPEKQDRRMQIRNSRQERRRNIPTVK